MIRVDCKKMKVNEGFFVTHIVRAQVFTMQIHYHKRSFERSFKQEKSNTMLVKDNFRFYIVTTLYYTSDKCLASNFK